MSSKKCLVLTALAAVSISACASPDGAQTDESMVNASSWPATRDGQSCLAGEPIASGKYAGHVVFVRLREFPYAVIESEKLQAAIELYDLQTGRLAESFAVRRKTDGDNLVLSSLSTASTATEAIITRKKDANGKFVMSLMPTSPRLVEALGSKEIAVACDVDPGSPPVKQALTLAAESVAPQPVSPGTKFPFPTPAGATCLGVGKIPSGGHEGDILTATFSQRDGKTYVAVEQHDPQTGRRNSDQGLAEKIDDQTYRLYGIGTGQYELGVIKVATVNGKAILVYAYEDLQMPVRCKFLDP
ncbi:MAG TPA: hypothetical protein VM925_05335 [Labilithrix sp.]|nr:hypothetical protein [Labilithrix sp.]